MRQNRVPLIRLPGKITRTSGRLIISGLRRANKKGRLTAGILYFVQAATACAFRFLRQPNRPIAPARGRVKCTPSMSIMHNND